MGKEKGKSRAKPERDQGMAKEAVADSLPLWRLQVLAHGHRVHVAHAALVQIARRRMMDRVLPAPVEIRRERQHAEDRTDDVVCVFRSKERAVPTVVLDDKQPHHKAGAQHHQRQHKPIGYCQRAIRQVPDDDKRNERVADLPDAFPCDRRLVFCNRFGPGRSSGLGLGIGHHVFLPVQCARTSQAGGPAA